MQVIERFIKNISIYPVHWSTTYKSYCLADFDEVNLFNVQDSYPPTLSQWKYSIWHAIQRLYSIIWLWKTLPQREKKNISLVLIYLGKIELFLVSNIKRDNYGKRNKILASQIICCYFFLYFSKFVGFAFSC